MPETARRKCECLRPDGGPWTESPVKSFTDDGDVIHLVLSDLPALRWSYSCVPNGDDLIVRLHALAPTSPTNPVMLDSLPYPLPTRRLAYYWQRARGGEPWNPFEILAPRDLPRRPDPRPYGGAALARQNPEYQRLDREATAPIAEEVRRADAIGCARHPHIAAMFNVSESQAETKIQQARDAGHDLPYIRPRKTPDPVQPVRLGQRPARRRTTR